MGVDLKIKDVVKRYGDFEVVKGLSVDIKPGEFFTLLGPSGCGKTTLLRMIIGFNTIDHGVIEVDGQAVNNIPIHKRNMGMVFQNYAVFPHMNVKDNVAYGLKNQKLSKEEINKRVEAILKVVKIEQLKDRMPDKLSGGQQQRVALARAIVTHPRVLLMDEPLSNLDAKLRVEMRLAIKNIQKDIGITTVYVTHDQEEALAVSDRIAVMNEGVIQQIGSPKSIYTRPVNTFVSNFIGTTNFFDATLQGNTISCNGYTFTMNHIIPDAEEKIIVSVRPHEFEFASDQNGMKGLIKTSTFLGMNTHYFIELENGQIIEAVDDRESVDILPDGSTVYLGFKTQKINVFDSVTKLSLIEGVINHEKQN